jgi:hypothetical protein
VIAEFNVWLLIVGLVVGAGLVWLVMMDSGRRETDIDAVELPREAAWLSAVLAEEGHQVSPETAEELLLLHRAYVGAPPPDPVEAPAAEPWRLDEQAALEDETGALLEPEVDREVTAERGTSGAHDAPAEPDTSGEPGSVSCAPSEAAAEDRIRVDG